MGAVGTVDPETLKRLIDEQGERCRANGTREKVTGNSRRLVRHKAKGGTSSLHLSEKDSVYYYKGFWVVADEGDHCGVSVVYG